MGGHFAAQGACMKRLIGYMAALCLLAIMVGCGGVSSTGTLAYISNKTGSGYTVYSVNTDGTLTLNSISPQDTPASPQDLQFSANGKWAYFLDKGGLNIYGYTRAGNGTLANRVGDPQPVGSGVYGASSLVISPNSNFVYVSMPSQSPTTVPNRLYIYSIDSSTGVLSGVGSGMQVGYAINHLVMSPSGTLLFGLSTSQQSIVSWTLNASTGVAIQQSVTSVGVEPNWLALSSNGDYAYVTDASATTKVLTTGTTSYYSPNIYGFTVGSGGVLTAMPDSPFNENASLLTGNYPTSPAFAVTSNDNRYLFVANQGSHDISVFQIATGSSTSTAGYLTEVLGSVTTVQGVKTSTASPFDCGTGCSSPFFMAVPPDNNALYVLDSGSSNLFQFQIDQNTGRLRAMSPASISGFSTPVWITLK
jgi:6-phosphogluconolactonase (cycloisomerase 2 family)